MGKSRVGRIKYYLIWFFILTSCVHSTKSEVNENVFLRCPAQQSVPKTFHLVPQENYGEEVLNLIKDKGKEGVTIFHFNFFTDNKEESYPKKIAESLEKLKKEFPNTSIIVALESKKDDGLPKGVATRNKITKKRFQESGIDVHDIHGQSSQLQTPPGNEDGVSHTKLIIVGNTIIAGSNNLTKQSTDVAANNEMNMSIESDKISKALRDYVNKIIQKPGEMVDMMVEDGVVRVLTDRLHFDELISQIKKAQAGDVVGLSMYQFLYRTDKDIQAKQVFDELLAANKRGALLQIFLNRAIDLQTQNSEANLRVAELLLNNNVNKIYFDPEGKISHSKFFYRISKNGSEKVSIISSVNIYSGDFNKNHQITMVINDAYITDQLDRYFKQQIAYDGTLLTRIPLDPISKLRYKTQVSDNKTSVWNSPVASKPMFRFWRGFKQQELSRVEFEKNLNQNLIPKTIEVGGGRGLFAYLPSLYEDNKPTYIPDEIALLHYADSETYNAIRSTKEGNTYGALHFQKGYFTQINPEGLKSGSIVAEEYQGHVEFIPEGRAYILGNNETNWQSGVSLRRTLLPINKLSITQVQNYLNELQSNFKSLAMMGAIVMVDPQYLILMLNVNNSQDILKLNSTLASLETNGNFSKFENIVLSNQKYQSTQLTPGAGINIQFNSVIQPREKLMSTVLVELKRQNNFIGGRCQSIFE